ncbi:MAG: CoA pyrophosphatase [Bacteroidales bacterium]|nr:CoA pyrophosphatase [Bacteroidales bacterium]
MDKAIDRIKNELKQALPGSLTQYSMAPDMHGIIQGTLQFHEAGVLLLLYPKHDQITTVFIKRNEYNGPHSGQISLPGGKSEPGDADIIHTALREAEEETGIDRHSVEILGQLTPLDIPVSSFKVFPVIGYTRHAPVFNPDKTEVEYLIETDIKAIIDPSLKKFKIMKIRGFEIEVPYFDIQGNHIWGATAMILAEFIEIIRRTRIFTENS